MEQIEVSKNLKIQDPLRRVAKHDVVITRKGHAVALLTDFDDEDLEWYEREHDPAFIESIKEAREQVKRGEVIGLEDLKAELGIDQPFETFLWDEVERLLTDGKAGESPWTVLRRLSVAILGKKTGALFDKHFKRENCSIRYEKLSAAELKALKVKRRPAHDIQPPGRTDEPIIVLEFKKQRILVDGKRRRTTWLKQQQKGPFPAIVIFHSP